MTPGAIVEIGARTYGDVILVRPRAEESRDRGALQDEMARWLFPEIMPVGRAAAVRLAPEAAEGEGTEA